MKARQAGPLAAGDQFLFAFSIKLGLYEVDAVTDRTGKITEAGETNNRARIAVSGR